MSKLPEGLIFSTLNVIIASQLPEEDLDLFHKFWGIFGTGPHLQCNKETLFPKEDVEKFYNQFKPAIEAIK